MMVIVAQTNTGVNLPSSSADLSIPVGIPLCVRLSVGLQRCFPNPLLSENEQMKAFIY